MTDGMHLRFNGSCTCTTHELGAWQYDYQEHSLLNIKYFHLIGDERNFLEKLLETAEEACQAAAALAAHS